MPKKIVVHGQGHRGSRKRRTFLQMPNGDLKPLHGRVGGPGAEKRYKDHIELARDERIARSAETHTTQAEVDTGLDICNAAIQGTDVVLAGKTIGQIVAAHITARETEKHRLTAASVLEDGRVVARDSQGNTITMDVNES